MNPNGHRRTILQIVFLGALISTLALGAITASVAQSAPRCFGQPAKVINQAGTHHLDRHEAVFINAPVRIVARGDNRICSQRHRANVSLGKGTRNLLRLGTGDDVVRVNGPTRETRVYAAGGDNRIVVNAKAARHVVQTGDGNDRITFHRRAKASTRVIHTGFGNDQVKIHAKGNTRATLGGRNNPRGLPNDNYYWGGRSNDTVHVYHGKNVIFGNNGSDRIYSLGQSRSFIHGGNGTDFIYSNGGDEIYGGRGQDRIFANQRPSIGPVYADGGPGDDTIYGTPHDDILLAPTGGNKFFGVGGDNLIRVGDGPDVIDGGSGESTLSFAGHTPPGWRDRSGVKIDMARGMAHGSPLGSGFNRFTNIANVIGSSFDDWIITDPRRPNRVWAGLGNDEIEAHDGDVIDGGLGRNDCEGGSEQVNCDGGQRRDRSQPLIDMSPDGVLTVLGTPESDRFTVSKAGGDYVVNSSRTLGSSSPDCSVSGGRATCSVPRLSRILVYSEAGDDQITIERSVPSTVSTSLDGGSGNNVIRGGVTNDYITSGRGESNLSSVGGTNIFQISATGRTTARGGRGPDVFKIPNPCLGHRIAGGGGKDGVVFAQSERPVEVNLHRGTARWRNLRSCAATQLAPDIQGAEGSRHSDVFIGTPRGRNGFLGRHGRNTFFTRHGTRDSIITGPEGRRNRVIADRHDKVVWGWGLAGVGG